MKEMHLFNRFAFICAAAFVVASLQGCASGGGHVFRDQNMDFGAIRTVAVLPFANYSRDLQASDRVRDVFITDLLATGAVYVLPSGEMARGVITAGVANPTAPSVDEIVKLCRLLKADAVITGNIREYGPVKSASAMSDVVSLSVQLIEGQTGHIVWSSSETEGGITLKDRLLGGGGQPRNDTTEKAVNAIINKLLD
jgi:hypothetical protein